MAKRRGLELQKGRKTAVYDTTLQYSVVYRVLDASTDSVVFGGCSNGYSLEECADFIRNWS